MSIFPKEVCYHRDPSCVYDCVAWNSVDKTYKLQNDAGDVAWAKQEEFTLVSMFDEKLMRPNGKGGFEIDKEAEALLCPPSHDEKPRRERTSKPGRAKGKKADPHDDAKAGAKVEVRELLSHCETREDIAEVAARVLGENARDLMGKYAKQDNGRFRMILGNRMRGVITRQKKA